MNKNTFIALNYKKTGFNDYKASRFLLQNDLFIQGITLASSAIEKYLKAILICNGIKKPVHLDKFADIQKEFRRINNNTLDLLDSNFLEILSEAYKLRYYDNFKGKVSFGFISTQVVAELDFSIKLLDSCVVVLDEKTNEVVKSVYQKSIEAFDDRICKDNYLVTGLSKKTVMEKNGKGYALMIDENGQEFEVLGLEFAQVEYDGKINKLLDLSFE